MKSQILKAKNAKGGSMKAYTIADYSNGKPSARWFTEAASCDVHHRRLREDDNKQFALID